MTPPDEPDALDPEPTPVAVPPLDEAPSSTGVVADDEAAEVDESP